MSRGSLFEDKGDGDVATVSDIKAVARDPNMRRVYVGRRAVATLRASDVAALEIRIGGVWTAALGAKVEREAAAAKARKQAMKMIARRAYSRGQLAEALERKGYEAEIARRVVDELAADRWIDDEAYARGVAVAIGSRKAAGARLMEAKLAGRKIESELAERVAREAASELGTVDAAEELVRRQMKVWTRLKPVAIRRRIEGLLSRRGFDEDVIEAVLSRLNDRDEGGE
ncbi:MAG: recombination regulator RecX [Phycisphaerales bacterium]|nr:recombination regulator RecX [Phycisphaerales bacterium]